MKGVPKSNAENDVLQTGFIRQKDPSHLESALPRTLTLSVVLQGLTLTLLTLSMHHTLLPQIKIQYDQTLTQIVLTSFSPPLNTTKSMDAEESIK